MSQHARKRQARKLIVDVLESKIPELRNQIVSEINNYPFKLRLKFAWKVLLGKV